MSPILSLHYLIVCHCSSFNFFTFNNLLIYAQCIAIIYVRTTPFCYGNSDCIVLISLHATMDATMECPDLKLYTLVLILEYPEQSLKPLFMDK